MALWEVRPASIRHGRREAGGEPSACIIEAEDARQAAERYLASDPMPERYYNNSVVVYTMTKNDQHVYLTRRNLPNWFGIRRGKVYRLK